jgi:hypothetical protein
LCIITIIISTPEILEIRKVRAFKLNYEQSSVHTRLVFWILSLNCSQRIGSPDWRVLLFYYKFTAQLKLLHPLGSVIKHGTFQIRYMLTWGLKQPICETLKLMAFISPILLTLRNLIGDTSLLNTLWTTMPRDTQRHGTVHTGTQDITRCIISVTVSLFFLMPGQNWMYSISRFWF